MEWVETTGKDSNEAKERAIDLLGVAGDQAEFEVLEEAKTGLFGRVKSPARIRARVRPTQPPPKQERRDRGGRKKSGKGGGDRNKGGGNNRGGGDRNKGGGNNRGGGDRNKGGGNNRGRDGDRNKGGGNNRGRDGDRSKAKADRNGGNGGSDRGTDDRAAGDRNNNSDRNRDRQPKADVVAEADPVRESVAPAAAGAAVGAAGAAAVASSSAGEQQKNETTTSTGAAMSDHEGDAMSLDEHAEVVAEFLDGLLESFDFEGDVVTKEIDEETLEVQVEGRDLGLLVGPKGNTLRAIQELSRTVVQRKGEGSPQGRVRIDVAGYRERRREALTRFAKQVAENVRESGNEQALESMSAADRKVVHDALTDEPGVSTISEGSDPHRCVVVIPGD